MRLPQPSNGSNRPLYLPGWIDPAVILEAAPIGDWSVLVDVEREQFTCPELAGQLEHLFGGRHHSPQYNRYGAGYRLGFHADLLETGFVADYAAVVGIDGRGMLSFVRDRERFDVELGPGDMVVWSIEHEQDGWLHGGTPGVRTSLAMRWKPDGVRRT